MAGYVAIIHKDEGSDFGVLFPDFPGCVSAGATLDEAAAMARAALALHVRGMREDGEVIPQPSSLSEALRHELATDAVACLVVEVPEESKTVRVNITLPEDELREIDAYARRAGLTRSGLLVMGAKMMMEMRQNQGSAHAAGESKARYGRKKA